MFTKLFWADATERAISTFAQTFLTIVTIYVPAISLNSTGDLEAAIAFIMATLPFILLASLGGAGFSIIKSVAATKKSGTDDASLSKRVIEGRF